MQFDAAGFSVIQLLCQYFLHTPAQVDVIRMLHYHWRQ